ncbi:hypothetical protein JTE90_019366 [Oedothorax gibbosus]|uniref:Receptor expression-enhancing protein n=1 Tax=Oedothorax gibbosus TaxID=931172 RepID=A0AAV6UK05_9ARAC|nr:hypothetical protein JTE90_019366 [Oedothorax gibbosus]
MTELIKENVDNIASGNVDKVASENVDNIASGNVGNVASENVDNIASGNVDNIASGNVGNIASRITEDYSERVANTIENFIENRASKFLETIERWSGIPAHVFITVTTICVLIFLMFSSGPFFILNILLSMYPAYQTFKALEAEDTDKCFEWLKFWIVFAIYHGVENIGDRLMWWMPGYGILKFVFLTWCSIPVEHNGTSFVFKYIHMILSNNVETLERLGEKVQNVYHRFV